MIPFIEHIVLTVSDIPQAKEFYSVFLGEPVEEEKDSIAFTVGKTTLYLGLPWHQKKVGTFQADRAGLNHLAFAVETDEELENLRMKLDANDIKNSGIKTCPYSKKGFIWFDDPNGIRLELYITG